MLEASKVRRVERNLFFPMENERIRVVMPDAS